MDRSVKYTIPRKSLNSFSFILLTMATNSLSIRHSHQQCLDGTRYAFFFLTMKSLVQASQVTANQHFFKASLVQKILYFAMKVLQLSKINFQYILLMMKRKIAWFNKRSIRSLMPSLWDWFLHFRALSKVIQESQRI